jgi:hypothetical protein
VAGYVAGRVSECVTAPSAVCWRSVDKEV